jgi:iron complex outermembrane recepter protein
MPTTKNCFIPPDAQAGTLSPSRRKPVWLGVALMVAALPVAAQTLSDVVVSANRVEQRAFDTAASVNVVNAEQIQEGQVQANLSESLVRVPGIFALNRQNAAQDLLISSRGFGANSAFGARGLRIIVDGIPGTVADGQGQMSHIDLSSAERIEVLRGPFSTLYGNSAGGVISVFTESGKPGTQVTPYFQTGSYGLRKYGVKVGGESGNINYMLDVGNMTSKGYRDHSESSRENENAKLRVKISDDTTVQLVANRVDLSAQDPIGLTAAQVVQNPRQAGNFALAYDTRKTVTQTQAGFQLTHRINTGNSLVITPYYGERRTQQYLAGSAANGSAAATNGVINLTRDYYGMDSKWLLSTQAGGRALRLASGVDVNQNADTRLTQNSIAGVAQAATATNQNISQGARNLDVYSQAEWRALDRLTLTAGARHSQTVLSSTSNNALPSLGSNTYRATTGMASAQWYVRDDTQVYVSYGSGFDTPTLNQVQYSSDNIRNAAVANTGNIGLAAANTRQLELGVKSELDNGVRVQAALFNTETRNDIVVAASNAGRTSYTNAPKTRRNGLELNAQIQLPWQLQAHVAYTWLDAKVATDYTSFVGNVATTIKSGNRIPGVPGRGLYTELMWRAADKLAEVALEARQVGDIVTNDANTAASSGYAIANLRGVLRQKVGGWTFTEFARVDNLFNRSYVGSVIVNQASSQFYEPAPGRNWAVGVKATWQF